MRRLVGMRRGSILLVLILLSIGAVITVFNHADGVYSLSTKVAKLGKKGHARKAAQAILSAFSDKEFHKLSKGEDAHLEHHPIDDLIVKAQKDHHSLLSKQTNGLDEAVSAYVARRGIPPPPGFDKWVRYAEERDAVMVEDFFDQIYRDLDPLWAAPPKFLRDATTSFDSFISIRNGNATVYARQGSPNLEQWASMISQIAPSLPDVDIAVNDLDSSRTLVPWEYMNWVMTLAKKRKPSASFQETQKILTDYPTLPSAVYNPELFLEGHELGDAANIWSLAREACPPGSPGRITPASKLNFSTNPTFPRHWSYPTYHGFVANWTNVKDPCLNPHLRGLHGTFVEPFRKSVTSKLFPVFGGSKLPMSNDIVLPAADYWATGDMPEETDKVPWDSKSDRVFWRGTATGGRNDESNWKRFHRHRFVSMLNGTQVTAEECLDSIKGISHIRIDTSLADAATARNFPMPLESSWEISAFKERKLGVWIESFADVGFTNLRCFPQKMADVACNYTGEFCTVHQYLPGEEAYERKYLPDIDGNAFSGRYLSLLRSRSLPIKATIYSEWHDARLVPWRHFVPLDNIYVDFWGIMEYFLGYDSERSNEVGSGVERTYTNLLRSAYGLDVLLLNEENLPNQGQAVNYGVAGLRGFRGRETPNLPVKQPHDVQAKAIAEAGHEWAKRVLRREDMLIYTYRLLLEYARLASDARERMAWIPR